MSRGNYGSVLGYHEVVAARAVGERRPLHRGQSSVENVSVTVQTSSQCASSHCEYDVDGTQESVGACETYITTGLRCKPAAQAEVCEVTRPGPRPGAAGGGPDAAETGCDTYFALLMPGVLLFARVPKASHVASIESNG